MKPFAGRLSTVMGLCCKYAARWTAAQLRDGSLMMMMMLTVLMMMVMNDDYHDDDDDAY